MRRFELEEEGSKKFWQVSVAGSELTVSFGRIGTKGQTKLKSLASPEAAEKEAAKLVREKTGKGYVEVGAVQVEVSAPAQVLEAPKEKVAEAGLEGFSEKALTRYAEQLAGVRSAEALEYEKLLYPTVDSPRIGPLLWHLVDAKYLVAEDNPGYVMVLAKHVAHASTDSLFALLTRLPASYPARDWQFFPGWFVGYDRLAVEAVRRAPERVLALLPTLPLNVRLGLQLVRGRSGMQVDEADRLAVLRGLATRQAEGHGLAPGLQNRKLQCVRGEALEPLVIATTDDVQRLALCFGSFEAWRDALLQGVSADRWESLETVAVALRALPLEELVQLLNDRMGTSFDDEEFFALLTSRNDDPEAFFGAIDDLDPAPRPSDNAIRDKLRVYAIATLGERGEPIPEGAEEGLRSVPFACSGKPSDIVYRSWCVRAVRALPPERAVALVERLKAMYPSIETNVDTLLEG